ncbi:uncharacterized protein LOC112081536 [Eutrema salsugineum]|uniref:uncharacterized protein LOC112081536 n=1 Tax=Eutrema salsugineum TaxID=72664 RepID=UPI000CED5445|nr:uncharacterized protein LOC112081536 [Eutrema salsugineum]
MKGRSPNTDLLFKNRTSLGPLIDITGDSGPRVSGLPINAVVADAISNGDWWIAASRSRSPIISLLRQCMPSSSSIISSEVDDIYLWKTGVSQAKMSFSSSETWLALYPTSVEVPWHTEVWFKGCIPKRAFISWVSARDRLTTRDRLVSWGLNVPTTCLLCDDHDETRQHLFFDCGFSSQVWLFFCSYIGVSPPVLFNDILVWLKRPVPDEIVSIILRLCFQASMYAIWKERNSRLHSATSRPASSICVEIQQQLRARLDSLSRAQRIDPEAPSYLSTWFSLFQSDGLSSVTASLQPIPHS